MGTIARGGVRYEEWLERKLQDPAFRAMYEGQRVHYQLARLRIQRGLTQKQLAEKVGKTQPSIARLESGRHVPTLDLLEQIATVLGARLTIRIEPLEDAEAGTECRQADMEKGRGAGEETPHDPSQV